MEIIINKNNKIIWMVDTKNNKGIANKGHVKSGLQDEIITALQNALDQAKFEKLSWENTY